VCSSDLKSGIFSNKSLSPTSESFSESQSNEKPHRPVTSKQTVTDHSDIDILVASLRNISSDRYATTSVVSGVSSLNRRITGSELARILKAANIMGDSDYVEATVFCSKLLRQPITAKDVSSILEPISSDRSHAKAASALMSAIKNTRNPAREN